MWGLAPSYCAVVPFLRHIEWTSAISPVDWKPISMSLEMISEYRKPVERGYGRQG
jgi:hypothetical protein